MKIELSLFPWPCALCDESGVLRETNAPWQKRFGRELELKNCLPQAHQNFCDALAAPLRPASFVCTLRAPGELAPLSLRFIALCDQDVATPNSAEPLWLVVVAEAQPTEESDGSPTERPGQNGSEIAEREDAERAMDGVALRIQARNWRAFFHEAGTGKALIGLQGETLEVNAALCLLTGYSEEALLNQPAGEIRHPDDDYLVLAHYQAIVNGGPPVTGIEARYLHEDGHWLTCLLSLTLIRDSRGKPLYFTAEVEDITSRREVEALLHDQTRELEQSNFELTRSNAELERFAFVASHDLQEPLRKIRVFGDRLHSLAASPTVDANLVRYIDVMTRSAERMQNLVNDLLAYGRLNNRDTAFASVNLDGLWDELRDEFDTTLRESDAHLEIGALPPVNGNAFRLRQLFANLLSNALKFRGDDPLKVQVSARLQEAKGQRPAMIEIEVRDNGIGFESGHAEEIFEVFARLHGRDKYPGTGIGLAICRRVAHEHGGDLRAFSTPGQGARFVVTLPL